MVCFLGYLNYIIPFGTKVYESPKGYPIWAYCGNSNNDLCKDYSLSINTR